MISQRQKDDMKQKLFSNGDQIMPLVRFPRWTRSPVTSWRVSEIVASGARAGIFPLSSTLLRPHLKCCVQFEPLPTRKTLRCWTMSREGQQSWLRVWRTSLRRSDGRSSEEEAWEGPYHSVQSVVARRGSVSSLR